MNKENKKSLNKHLHLSKIKKDDEFYTFYEDIEKELINYRHLLKGKKIVCPCDNEDSNFVKFLNDVKEEWEIDTVDNFSDNFESVNYDNYDIVITNPPFSKFNLFFDTIKHKKFIIIMNYLNVVVKKYFDLIKNKEIQLGWNEVKKFNHKDGVRSVFTHWFTNMDVAPKRIKLPNNTMTIQLPFIENNLKVMIIPKIKDFPRDCTIAMALPPRIFYYDLQDYDIINTTRFFGGIFSDGKELFTKIIIRRKHGK